MYSRLYQPHPLLREFVNTIILGSESFDRTKPLSLALCPPLPDSSLQFYPRDPVTEHKLGEKVSISHSRTIIVPSCTERINLSLGYEYTIIRVGFHPGGLHRLLRLPMDRVVNSALNAEEFFGTRIKEVNEQLQATSDHNEMIRIVEAFLLQQIKKAKQLDSFDLAMQKLMKSDGNLSMEYLAKESYTSFRQFQRKCKERIGIGPKLFARIIRFSNAYRMHEAKPQLTWTELAHDAGYFDQNHFIRDFKEFAGVTPTLIDKELSRTPVRLQSYLTL